SHGPSIGVFVRRVSIDGVNVPHPLIGARFDLVGPARFESVNEVVMEQGTEALEPFEVRISHGSFALQRRAFLDPAQPDLTVYTASRAALETRRATYAFSTDMMQEAVGSRDPLAFRTARRKLLEEDLAVAPDASTRAALTRRISELSVTDPSDRRIASMQFIERRHYELNGATTIVDRDGIVGTLDTTSTFPCDIVMGSWDADALSFYTTGTLTLLTR
ncbi:MAG TPA: hypothetical protein VK427_14245, partial [Kofleriaceae bacterium]|nr:hypothetical protein [Kofleriaceae bacterium]